MTEMGGADDESSCTHCGAALTFTGTHCGQCGVLLSGASRSLFSTVAADYAQVVSESDSPITPENIWSTSANSGGVGSVEEIVEEDGGLGELVDDDVTDDVGPENEPTDGFVSDVGDAQSGEGSDTPDDVFGRYTGCGDEPLMDPGFPVDSDDAGDSGPIPGLKATPFSSAPPIKDFDVVEEPEDILDVWDDLDSELTLSPFAARSATDGYLGSPGAGTSNGTSTSAPNRSASTPRTDLGPDTSGGVRSPVFGFGGHTNESGLSSTDYGSGSPQKSGGSFQPGDSSQRDNAVDDGDPAQGGRDRREFGSGRDGAAWLSSSRDEPTPPDDEHGYAAAIDSLQTDQREAAADALTVAGALLADGEQVRGVVTGQMLGRPAAVVVTDGRVIIANDRRWRPIVDVYQLGESLAVRGRHDGQVSAMTFTDPHKFSIVDGIGDVARSIDLAMLINTSKTRR